MGKECVSLKVLSLGWGVQSWTMAAMSALGELPAIDYAVHADTGHEMAATYAFAAQWTPWLEERGLRVVTVRGDRTEVVVEEWSSSVVIPAFTTDNVTGKHGVLRRQCTHDWKITPIRRFLRTLLPPRPKPVSVESWQGISADEARRMHLSDVKYIVHVYPLAARFITRADCIAWLQSRGLAVPVKSSCTFCPYHALNVWRQLKRAGGPDWQEAVEVDRAIRLKRPKCNLFVHPARQPLEDAVGATEQMTLWEEAT